MLALLSSRLLYFIYMRKCAHCKVADADSAKNYLCRLCFNKYMREYKKKNYNKITKIHRESRLRIYHSDPRQRIKDRANKVVKRALDAEKIKRQPCKKCSNPKAEAHHDSYYRKDWLKIRWLCRDCHAEWHRKHKPSFPKNEEIIGEQIELAKDRLKREEILAKNRERYYQEKIIREAEVLKARNERREKLQALRDGGMTLGEIGKLHSLTRERIRQILLGI